jgi:hypothetical protein
MLEGLCAERVDKFVRHYESKLSDLAHDIKGVQSDWLDKATVSLYFSRAR